MKSTATNPRAWLVALLLAVAIAVVYGRSLDAPFLMDDTIAIVDNPSITALWPLVGTSEHPGPLKPPRDLPTSGRPLVNLSFALNHAFGNSPVGYHIINAFIHFLSALLLWAIVRRTVRVPRFNGRFDSDAGWIAFAASLLWALHPLQTETIIYSTQRTELMMAFFYLATIYCSLRYFETTPLPLREGQGEGSALIGNDQRPPNIWLFLATLACSCGMASKEVMVSAPVIVLLYDRTFVSGSFVRALRQSRSLYLGLFASWIVLLALNLTAPRSGSAGFHFDVPTYVWWFTQCQVVLLYLKLVVWPWPLLVQYQLPYVNTLSSAWMYVVPITLLAIVTIILLRRNNPIGFLLTFMAAILAPTSVVPIMTEMAAERRMYLPLAAVVVLFVVGVYWLIRWGGWGGLQRSPSSTGGSPAARPQPPTASSRRALASVLIMSSLLALVAGVGSANRLADYYDEHLLWRQVAENQPKNFVAHYNLGLLLNEAGREQESLAELQTSVDANPNYPDSLSALGFALINAGRLPEALDAIQAALDIRSDHVPALNNMGIALTRLGRYPEAIEKLQLATKINPNHAPARDNLGKALLAAGQPAEALEEFRRAAMLTPTDADVVFDLANAFAATNQLPDAIQLFQHAIELRPDFAAAHNALGVAYFHAGDIPRATQQFKKYLDLKPDDAGAHINFANILAAQGDFKNAAPHYKEAVRIRPDFAEGNLSLAMAHAQLGNTQDAVDSYKTALRLKPGLLPAYINLAEALAQLGQKEEAARIATQGIEAARQAGDANTAAQLETWVKQHPAK